MRQYVNNDVHHEGTKDTKDLEINSLTLNFVLFAIFVVKTQVRLWLRLCRAGFVVVPFGNFQVSRILETWKRPPTGDRVNGGGDHPSKDQDER
jgi:hypothetical protein